MAPKYQKPLDYHETTVPKYQKTLDCRAAKRRGREERLRLGAKTWIRQVSFTVVSETYDHYFVAEKTFSKRPTSLRAKRSNPAFFVFAFRLFSW
ncbi:MAG: hypothetical protein FWF87_02685 [Synergistaceae bacterium]|nr:hypothetical protein [Synergistaceae bacterium]